MQAVPLTEKDSSGTSLPEASIPEELACKNQPISSYQQISCLDSVIRCGHARCLPCLLTHSRALVSHEAPSAPPRRYLESCSEATTLKRKCEFPANSPAPQASDKRRAGPGLRLAGILFFELLHMYSPRPSTWDQATAGGLEPPPLPIEFCGTAGTRM